MDNELHDVKKILGRRKKGFFLTFAIIFLIGIVVAIALPPVYRSEATIRLEDQQISEEFVSSSFSEYIEEQIAKISQQVLNRERLTEIVDKLNLLSEGGDAKNAAQFVGKIKENILLEAIGSDFADSESQRKGRQTVTMAFNLSYQGDDAPTVQKVTATLANLFLEEDVKRRERVVSVTNEFLIAEQKRLKSEINSYENKISEYKKAHLHELPDDRGYNLQAILRLEREMDKNQNRFQLLQEKEMLLNAQLAKVEPLTPIVVEGSNVASNPNKRLKELYFQLTKLRSIYSDRHPDIRKIKNEIAELETQVKHSDVSVEKVKRLNQLEDQLTEMQGAYGPEHPEIKAVKNEIRILKPEVNNLMTETVKIKISEEKPDNPAYINIVTQINATKMEMAALHTDNKKMLQEIDKFHRRSEKAPFVEKELNALNRDLDSAQNKYSDISNKILGARVTKDLEGKQKGQRFSILSSAYLPVKPFKPNRLLIIILGFVAALVVSSFFVALREGMDSNVRTSEQIKQITGVPVLSSVSYIVTSEERRFKRKRNFLVGLAIFLSIGILLVIIDQFVMSFDDLTTKIDQIWSLILERIKMIA